MQLEVNEKDLKRLVEIKIEEHINRELDLMDLDVIMENAVVKIVENKLDEKYPAYGMFEDIIKEEVKSIVTDWIEEELDDMDRDQTLKETIAEKFKEFSLEDIVGMLKWQESKWSLE